MRRLMMMAGALGVALVMSSGAFAQVPPDPNNPNEKVPEKMLGATPYGEPIRICATPRRLPTPRSTKRSNGNGTCASRSSARAAISSISKKWITASMRRSPFRRTRRALRRVSAVRRVVFERLMGKGDFFAYLPTLGDAFIGSRGGNPLIVGGKIVGAIGASDGTGSQDDTISQAGVAGLK